MTFSRAPRRVASVVRGKILEVIVTSREEAVQAELYGADRLELVRSLEDGGLTPEIDVVRAVVEAVSIPVRVMVRERNSMSIAGGEELLRLQEAARSFSALPIDGLVLGFVAGSTIDADHLRKVLAAAPHCRVTFHRAFESVCSPRESLQVLKQFRQVDRILVRLHDEVGGVGVSDLVQWQKLAAPEIEFIVGLGLERNNISRVREQADLSEVHAGRLLREPEAAWGRLSRNKFLELKSALE
jgi:copper homeostasis protein